MNTHRNIRRVATGYQVRCYRRHKKTLVKTFPSLRMAQTALRHHEATFPAGRPWSDTPRKARPRTTAVLRAERRAAGLCIYCGEKARRGMATCLECYTVKRLKEA